MTELRRGEGLDPIVDRAIADTGRAIEGAADDEAGARLLVERMATCWTATLLVRHGEPAVADAYIRSRLGGNWGAEFGTLTPDPALAAIAGRAVPAVA